MSNLFLIAIAHAFVTIVVVLVWLVRAHLKLKQNYQLLMGIVENNKNDIAGLCSAALTVDSYIAVTDERLKELSAKFDDFHFQHNEQFAHPYSVVIQKVRNGASVDELMRDCNLCRDEAVLLTRLHGSNRQF